MTELTRRVGAALMSFTRRNSNSSAIFFSSNHCRCSHSTQSSSTDKFEAADQVLIEDSAAASVPEVATVPNLLQRRVVVYDGVCHLCHTGVKWIIKADKDKKIKFCCLQSKAAEPYMKLCGLEREDVLRRFLFVEGPGVYHQGSAELVCSWLTGFIVFAPSLFCIEWFNGHPSSCKGCHLRLHSGTAI